MVSTVSLVAVPLRPPASSPAPALFLLLVPPCGDYQTLTDGLNQGVKECTLYGFAAGFTKLLITLQRLIVC
jgi:hypothetical protein